MSSEPGKKKKNSQPSRVFSIFVGSVVNILLRDTTTKDENSSLTINGILLDECDDYFYLGSEIDVNCAVSKKAIGLIMFDNQPEEKPFGTVEQ